MSNMSSFGFGAFYCLRMNLIPYLNSITKNIDKILEYLYVQFSFYDLLDVMLFKGCLDPMNPIARG